MPDMTGRYTILIKYGGDEIPYSPYRIRALPTGDASKCTVTGMSRTVQPPNMLLHKSYSYILAGPLKSFRGAHWWIYVPLNRAKPAIFLFPLPVIVLS